MLECKKREKKEIELMDINEKEELEEELVEEKEEKFTYKNIFEKNKNSRAWSVASIGAGILSIIFCFLPILGIIFSLISVALAVVSRRVLGYFENLAVIGLVIGIFGAVFGIAYSVFQALYINTSLFK